MERVAERAPARRLVTIEEVGAACVFLASPYASAMTGDTSISTAATTSSGEMQE